jgi:hypothetical protein
LCWCYFYLAIASFDENAFSYHIIKGSLRENIQHFIYFSYITLTTVGYGDMIPLSSVARTFAWMEAATGQIYLAVWISQLVAVHIAQGIKKSNSTLKANFLHNQHVTNKESKND